MGFILLLFFYLLIFLLWEIIVTLAFPEVALYIIVVLFSMFLPNEIGGRYIELLEFFQPFIHYFQRFTEAHLSVKLFILLSIPLSYLLLSSLLQFYGIYPLQIIGSCMTIVTVFYLLNVIFQLALIWNILLTVPVSLVAIGIRLVVYHSLNKYFRKCTYLFTFLLKEKNEKKDTSEHTQQSSDQNRNNEKTSLVINEPFELEAYFRLILGVDEQATKEEIKHAYRQKVMKYHPDKSVEENAKEKYEEIIEAYKYLK